jgi:hypothetical protein
VRRLLPLFVVAAALLAGCAASPAASDASDSDSRAVVTASATPTPTPVPTVAPVVPVAPAPPPAPVAAPAPAYVDYVTPVTNRWGGCFSRLGVGDIYYDSVSNTVTGGWNGGVLTWSVGPGNASGTPADQGSVDALAGC